MLRASAFVGFVNNSAFFVGDPDTLIKNPAADVMSFEAGGVEFVRFTETTQDVLVVNEDGVDIDTRIESDSRENAFFLDGANGRISMNMTTPSNASADFTINVGAVDTDGLHISRAESMRALLGINASDAGVLKLRTGTSTECVLDPTAGYVFNEAGSDVDFRVESDTSPNAFGIDGGGAGFVFFGPDPNGARMRVKCVSTELTAVSGATVTATDLIPAGAKYLGVTTRITTELGGTVTGYTVGDGSDADRWGTVSAITAGTTTSVPTAEPFGFTAAALSVVLTALTANFNGTGAIRVTVHYIDYAGPTS